MRLTFRRVMLMQPHDETPVPTERIPAKTERPGRSHNRHSSSVTLFLSHNASNPRSVHGNCKWASDTAEVSVSSGFLFLSYRRDWFPARVGLLVSYNFIHVEFLRTSGSSSLSMLPMSICVVESAAELQSLSSALDSR